MCPKLNNVSVQVNTYSSLCQPSPLNSIALPQLNSNNIANAQLLMTGYTWICTDNKRVMCRILLDPGSQRSFVSNGLLKALGATPKESRALVTCTIGGRISKIQECGLFNLTLRSRFSPQDQIAFTGLGLSEITKGCLPSVGSYGLSPIADHLEKHTSTKIEVLLGTDVLPRIMSNNIRLFDDIVATQTKLGWFFYGTDKSVVETDTHSILCVLNVIELPSRHETFADDADNTVNLATLSVGNEPSDTSTKITEIDDDYTRDVVVSKENLKFLWDVEQIGIDDLNNITDSQLNEELNIFF